MKLFCHQALKCVAFHPASWMGHSRHVVLSVREAERAAGESLKHEHYRIR